MSGASIQEEVSAALAEVGQATGTGKFNVTINRPAAQPENPWDAPVGSPVPYQVRAVIEEYTQDQIDGTLIRAGDRRVLLDPTVIEPTTADRVVIDGAEYAIVRVQAEAPTGVPLIYTLQVRR